MNYIFIDTNIFLHFEDFDKIDWRKESNFNLVTLVIAPIVLDELDKKKIGTDRIGKRARQILQLFEIFIDNQVQNTNFEFKLLIDKPLESVYLENNLNFQEQDHRLIASIIDFKQNSNIENVALCTNDIGPRLKARQHGIIPLKLGEKYALPIQQSDTEKELKKLKQENIKLKNTVPKIALQFDNSKEFIKISVKRYNENYENFKAQKLAEIKQKLPYMEYIDPYKQPIAGIISPYWPDSSQISKYNDELNNYFQEYEGAIKQMYENKKRESLTFAINLQVSNSGTTPADDVDIHLVFPDGLKVYKSSEFEYALTLPEPPYKPKSSFDFGTLNTLSTAIISPKLNTTTKANVKLEDTNARKVDFNQKKLKHGYSHKLDNLAISFNSYDEINNLTIAFTLSASNVPEKTVGKLNVVFIKQ